MSESVVGVQSTASALRTPVGEPSSGRARIDPHAVYSLGSGGGESERLRRQADELAPESEAMLDRAGLRSGHSAIDLGCGPRGVIEMLCERVSPGGRVVSVEPDCETCIYYPPHPAFDRLAELFTVAFSRNGADPNIGRRLAELYRDAGLQDVVIEARSGVYPLGHSRRTIRPDLVRTLRSQILALGVADEQELDELDAAARTHLADPDVVVMPGLYFLAAGRKPAAA
jgi:hypothetical protein